MRRFAIVAILSLFVVEASLAHGGRTNSSGCHKNRKTGDYHCHGGSSSYSSGSRSSSRNYRSTSSTSEQSSQTSQSSQPQKSELITEIQKNLNALGYKTGLADGVMGKKTEQAISKFQMDNGLTVTGKPTESLRSSLRSKISG